jgi:26S proteasome non-ATPase regulatory subunit 9
METARRELLELEERKRAIVEEAEALLEVLNAPLPDGSPGVGLTGKLVDDEGFPRADVDLYQVRTLRHQLACLKTDRKALEAEIEAKLVLLHDLMQRESEPIGEPATAQRQQQGEQQPSTVVSKITETATPGLNAGVLEEKLVPIARVDLVMNESPAALAGLHVGDRVLRYGDIKFVAGQKDEKPQLADIASETSRNLGQSIPVEVMRGMEHVKLFLTPQAWSGPGSLGCHLMPV